MPRKLRLEYPGSMYHAMSRGDMNNKPNAKSRVNPIGSVHPSGPATDIRSASFVCEMRAVGFVLAFGLATGALAQSFTTLHSFDGSDGAEPRAGLLLSGNALYGTTFEGGTNGYGAVFALNTNGTGFTNLHSFTAAPFPHYTNSDGAYPFAALILSGNTLYGTAQSGGTNTYGTVFALNTDGTSFTVLHTFGVSGGADPEAALFLAGNTLYGAAVEGGTNTSGTVFALNSDGTDFKVLHTFTGGSDGAAPRAGLLLSGNTLYGTAQSGGTNGNGTVFGLTLAPAPPPQLTIMRSGTNVVLTWPADPAGYGLQSAPQATGLFVNIPGATSPYTNPITGEQQYFRLMK
jgi:uncharacterized repeat protein (TIGR03803 family)